MMQSPTEQQQQQPINSLHLDEKQNRMEQEEYIDDYFDENYIVFPSRYAPLLLANEQKLEKKLEKQLQKLSKEDNTENEDKTFYGGKEMKNELKKWLCNQCGVTNYLFNIFCHACKKPLDDRARITILTNICKEYYEPWSIFQNNQFNIRILFGSAINHLYLITVNPQGIFTNNDNIRGGRATNFDRKVLRIYPKNLSSTTTSPTRKHLEDAFDIFYHLGLGPKVLARFEIGHIEDHIDGKKIFHGKQRDDSFMKWLAKSMATLHSLKPEQIPDKNNAFRHSEKTRFLDRIQIVILKLREHINLDKDKKSSGFEYSVKDLQVISNILDLFPKGFEGIISEFYLVEKEIISTLEKADLPWETQTLMNHNGLVLSHNDIYQGNILELYDAEQMKTIRYYRRQSDFNQLNQYIQSIVGKAFKLIDYETCGWNFRYYDIANWFIELAINYTRVGTYPFVRINYQDYPDLDFQKTFIDYYLKELTGKSIGEYPKEKIDIFIKLTELCGLLSNLYKGVSSFLCGMEREHDFPFILAPSGQDIFDAAKDFSAEPRQHRMDYFHYAFKRLEAYCTSKKKIQFQCSC